MTDAVANIITIAGDVIDFIADNAIMMAFMCTGLVGVGISVVKRLVGRY